jgi:hypothetical protein
MSCPQCSGLGFVRRFGDFSVNSATYKDIRYVTRCPLYIDYFRELGDAKTTKPLRGVTSCNAAIRRHEEVFMRHTKEPKGRRDRL